MFGPRLPLQFAARAGLAWEVSEGEAMAAGMRVGVEELTVSVAGKGGARKLLQDVSFLVEPGEVAALMGPSGAGKTTLLNRVVGRGITGEVSGRITYSGHSIDKIRSRIGYVTQDDIMYETLTPRENLNFTAAFVQGRASAQQQREAVEAVLHKLRLVKCADTVVGSPGLVKGVSGGERKRTNVAMSLLGKPQLLLLDEPTSGLDATMAAELMADVSAIAKTGCTVIATIHQPSEAVFEAFTKVLLLDAGRLAYFGPVLGLRQKLGGLGFATPEQKPLPELLLEILEHPREDSTAADREAHATRLTNLRNASEASQVDTAPTMELLLTQRLGPCGQLRVLFWRGLLNLRRSKVLTVVRTMQTVLSAALIGWIFVQLEHDIAGVNTRIFAAFLLVFTQLLFAVLGVVNTFPAERAVFLREAQDRWYSPAAFYLSKVVIDTVMQALFPVLVTAIGYPLIGLNTGKAERIVYFYLIIALCANCGAAMGFAVSAAVSNVSTALAIAPGMIMPQMLLSGIFIRTDDLPEPFKSLSYIMLTRYALNAAVTNEFTCETDDACTDAWRRGGDCADSPCDFCCTDEEQAISGGVCPVITCEDALRFVGLDSDHIWPAGETSEDTIAYNVLGLLVLMVCFRMLGLLLLLLSYRKAARSG